MYLTKRLIRLTAAATILVIGSAACGEDYANPIETLPPIRTTTTTFVPETTIDTTRYFYTVQPGDNLNKIAVAQCVPLAMLKELNADVLPDPNNIPVGVQIEIPSNVAVIDCVSATSAP